LVTKLVTMREQAPTNHRPYPMKLSAVVQAKARLAKAERSLAAFRSATEIEVAEEAWTDFLQAISAIYAKLEQGAKGNNASTPWFGIKKHDQKVDPLLRYLHFARNSNEHGIERVAATTPNNRFQGRELKFNERIPVKIAPADPVARQPTGPFVDAVAAGPTLRPSRVRNRGQDCDPPHTHFGVEIQLASFVDGLAEAAILTFAKCSLRRRSILRTPREENFNFG
jgi:hypothetical protein